MAVESGAVFKIRNDSGAIYTVDELGGVEMAPGETVDLMDESIPKHYTSWEAARTLAYSLPTAKLYRDIKSGDIVVTEAVQGRPVELPRSAGPRR